MDNVESCLQMVLSGLKKHFNLLDISQKRYNEESDAGYFLEVEVKYTEKLPDLHSDLPFLPEKMKIEKVEKLVANLHDKEEYVIHIRNLKQVWNHGWVF